jgi:hypothetical protein
MEQKTILQLTALGTFSFALGIISTLTIQTIVGPQSTPSSSALPSSSEVVSSIEPSSIPPTGPWQGFSNELEVEAAGEELDWEGLTADIQDHLEENYPGYDIDGVYPIGDEVFVFIELDYLINNEINIDTDLFLLYQPDGTLNHEIIFNTSDSYALLASERYMDNQIADIKYNPRPYRDGVLFTMTTYASVNNEAGLTPIDGYLSFVLEDNFPQYINGLYYFDVYDQTMHIIEQYDSDFVNGRRFNYTDFQVDGNRYLIGRYLDYDLEVENFYPFDMFEQVAQSTIIFDYASYDPSDDSIVLIRRFGFVTHRAYIDIYSSWSSTTKGEDVDFKIDKLALNVLIYITPESFVSEDPWFSTINMDLDLLRDSLGNVVASIDPGSIDGWYQLQYSVLFDLNGLEIEHLLLWNNLDDLAYDPQGYLVYDFEKERYFKFNFTFNFLELDEVFYVDTLVEYYSFDGTLLHTLEFDGAFDVYSLFENEFGQFVIGGKTVNVASIEGEDRLVDMGFTIYLFDENLNALDVIEFVSVAGVELWFIRIEETEVTLLISVGGGVYEGLLEPYSGLTSEHLLLIRISMVPQTVS